MSSIAFAPASPRWATFYSNYIMFKHEPNAQGWVNFPCVLPTHLKADSGEHGSINVFSGNYRCWHDDCRVEANRLLNKPDIAQTISPIEFLMLHQSMTYNLALTTVESYRLTFIDKGFVAVDDDQQQTFAPLTSELAQYLELAQGKLHPELEIVMQYCQSRGLRYETLARHKVGYVPESDDEEEALVFPYYIDGVPVALRARTIDGRKGGVKNTTYCPYNLDVLDQANSNTVIIVEGETDTLRLEQLLLDNEIPVPVIGTPGVRFRAEWVRHVARFSRLLAVPQADSAAAHFTTDLKRALGDRIEITPIPWREKEWGKDVADFCRTVPDGAERLVKSLGLIDYDSKASRVLSLEEVIELGKQEPDWLVPDLLERGTIALQIGEPKSFKTWIALQLIRSVALAVPFLGIDNWTPTRRGRSLLVEEEGSLFRLGHRLGTLFKDDRGEVSVIHRENVRLDIDESFQMLRTDVIDLDPDLLVLDPYASLHLQDENTVMGTMLVMKRIQQLLRVRPSLTIVIVHHTPKGGTTARGSGALYGSVDTQIHVRLDEKDDIIELKIRGRDLTNLPEQLRFAWDPATGLHKPVGNAGGIHIAQAAIEKKTSPILQVLIKAGDDGATADEIAEGANMAIYSVRTYLTKLESEGKIRKEQLAGKSHKFVYFAIVSDETSDDADGF